MMGSASCESRLLRGTMMVEQLTHTRSCGALTPGEDCTCCLQERQNTQTAETMHAAWRKRAEEAEQDRDTLKACLAVAIQMTEAAWSELSYKERAELRPTLDCWKYALKTPNV